LETLNFSGSFRLIFIVGRPKSYFHSPRKADSLHFARYLLFGPAALTFLNPRYPTPT
jgi:hypothetical protein